MRGIQVSSGWEKSFTLGPRHHQPGFTCVYLNGFHFRVTLEQGLAAHVGKWHFFGLPTCQQQKLPCIRHGHNLVSGGRDCFCSYNVAILLPIWGNVQGVWKRNYLIVEATYLCIYRMVFDGWKLCFSLQNCPLRGIRPFPCPEEREEHRWILGTLL